VLVQAAGWAVAGSKGSRLELTKSGRALLGKSLGAAEVRQVWGRWLTSDLLDELSRVRAIKGQQSKSARLTKPSVRRGTLAAVLGACPVGRWVGLDELFRYVRAHHLGPTIERSAHSALYIGWSMEAGWLEYAGTDYWDLVVGTYLRAVLWEYVGTLGLIDIAYTYPEDSVRDVGRLYGFDEEYVSRYDGLLGIRLTPLGAYVLGLTDEYRSGIVDPSQEKPSLRVLPNLDVVVLDVAALTPADRALLERIGAPQSQGVYRLDRGRILEATEQGVTLERVQELLVRKSGVADEELPQTVRVFLADVDRRASAIRETGRMVLLESKDPYLLIELANKPSLRAFVCLASIGDSPALLVPEAHQARARRELLKLGYVPRRP
jgi:Helicase conserved C-terminal domain